MARRGIDGSATLTESTDVFEWESVDEVEAAEEAEEAGKAAKGKKASAAKPKKGNADEDGKDGSTPKPLKSIGRSNSVKKSVGAKPKPSAQGSLKDFFEKPKK